ncbi:MAG: hypothetical protein V3V09_04125 [Arenicellales bacterium]
MSKSRLIVTLLFWLFPGLLHASTHLPAIGIKISTLPIFIEHQRTLLDIETASAQPLLGLRCYFKTTSNQQWFYIKAQYSGINRYQCELPIFPRELRQIKTQVLAITAQEKVVRTPALTLEKHSPAFPENEAAIAQPNLIIYDELGAGQRPLLYDTSIKIIFENNDAQRYGLVAGLYSEHQIPIWLGAKQGYFGGFEYQQSQDVTYPVKGYAPGLSIKPDQAQPSLRGGTSAPLAALKLNLNGDDWQGVFGTRGFNNHQFLTSNVQHIGNNITLTTSKFGIAHRFIGTINSSGHMLVYDQFDGEDWSTHLGPARPSEVKLFDFIRPPSAAEPNPPLNFVEINRNLVPEMPILQANLNTDENTIQLNWLNVINTVDYWGYRCSDISTQSCVVIFKTTALSHSDTPPDTQIYYYRVKACNAEDCSDFSHAHPARIAEFAPSISAIIMLLLL